MSEPVYLLMTRAAYDEARHHGIYHGSPQDRADGYLHCTTAATARASADAHWPAHPDLLMVTVDQTALGHALKWERNRHGVLFPHLYAVLPFAAITHTVPLPLGADGTHQFPKGF